MYMSLERISSMWYYWSNNLWSIIHQKL